jgi:hypothetical protein
MRIEDKEKPAYLLGYAYGGESIARCIWQTVRELACSQTRSTSPAGALPSHAGVPSAKSFIRAG